MEDRKCDIFNTNLSSVFTWQFRVREQTDTVRRAVNGILQQAEPPEPNITREMRDALKSLKEDESIMVHPADKGRASVVMDIDTYRAKMSTLIENGPYQLLNKDPTDRLTR